MEKVIKIDDKEVKLKVTMNCARLYKAQFRRHLLHDIFPLTKLNKYVKNGELQASDEVIAEIDFEVFSNLLWVFAKKADPSIPPIDEWEDQFTSLPIRTIFPEISEMLTILLDNQSKEKKHLAQVAK